MKITFFGHSAVLMEGSGLRILVDPYLLENPFYSGTLQDVGPLDYIFVTHGHFDHLGDAKALSELTGAKIVSNPEIVGFLGGGIGMQPSSWIGMDGFSFKAVPASHTSGIPTANGPVYGGEPFGFLFKLDGFTLYHAGDTGLIADMALLKYEDIDLAMLPIGGFYTMDQKEALRALDMIGPKMVMPMHYNTFPAIQTDLSTFKPHVPVFAVKPGETREFAL